jgi:hypothetical protein
LEYLIEILINLVSLPDQNAATFAAGILSNLTCNNEINKIAVFNSGGILKLLSVVSKSMDKLELLEATVNKTYK